MITREHKIIRVQHAIPIHNGHRRGVSQSLLYDILCYPGHELPLHIFPMLKNFSITKGTSHGRVYSEAIDVVRGRYFPRPKRLYSMWYCSWVKVYVEPSSSTRYETVVVIVARSTTKTVFESFSVLVDKFNII